MIGEVILTQDDIAWVMALIFAINGIAIFLCLRGGSETHEETHDRLIKMCHEDLSEEEREA